MAFIVRPVRPNVFFISPGWGLVDMEFFPLDFRDFKEMPTHCSRSVNPLGNSVGKEYEKQTACHASEGQSCKLQEAAKNRTERLFLANKNCYNTLIGCARSAQRICIFVENHGNPTATTISLKQALE